MENKIVQIVEHYLNNIYVEIFNIINYLLKLIIEVSEDNGLINLGQ